MLRIFKRVAAQDRSVRRVHKDSSSDKATKISTGRWVRKNSYHAISAIGRQRNIPSAHQCFYGDTREGGMSPLFRDHFSIKQGMTIEEVIVVYMISNIVCIMYEIPFRVRTGMVTPPMELPYNRAPDEPLLLF